jgi:integrase
MGELGKQRYLYRKQVKGHEYVYFRQPDGKLIRLPDNEHSSEFRRSYDACVKAITKPIDPPHPTRTRPAATEAVGFVGGTIGAAIKRYLASAEFDDLRPSSRSKYSLALVLMRDMIGGAKLADLDVDAVDIYADQLATERGHGIAHMHVALLANLWRVCRKYPEFGIKGRPSPTTDAEKYRKVKNPHRPWSDEAQELFMKTASDELKLAKLMLHFSAQRGGDCVRMRWADFDGQGLLVFPEKTSSGEDHEPNYHLCPAPLLAALLARQAQGDLAETILTSSRGKPWASAASLSGAIRDHLTKIGLAAPGNKTISMHGLRKNAAGEVGSLLLGSKGIQSVTGHRSSHMADYYAKHADQIALNRQVVERWNEALAEKGDRQVAKRRASLRRVK